MKLEQDILKLFDLFHQNNKELYIIGGAVIETVSYRRQSQGKVR